MLFLDTNVYVDAVADPGFRAQLVQFARAHTVAVSSVVVAEILMGKAPAQRAAALQAMIRLARWRLPATIGNRPRPPWRAWKNPAPSHALLGTTHCSRLNAPTSAPL